MTTPYTLPPATVQDYARQGAVVLRGVLTPDEVATLARGIEHNLAHLSPLALVLVEAVTGQVPFAADTTLGTLMARVGKPHPGTKISPTTTWRAGRT